MLNNSVRKKAAVVKRIRELGLHDIEVLYSSQYPHGPYWYGIRPDQLERAERHGQRIGLCTDRDGLLLSPDAVRRIIPTVSKKIINGKIEHYHFKVDDGPSGEKSVRSTIGPHVFSNEAVIVFDLIPTVQMPVEKIAPVFSLRDVVIAEVIKTVDDVGKRQAFVEKIADCVLSNLSLLQFFSVGPEHGTLAQLVRAQR
jgi:hypothetical protein